MNKSSKDRSSRLSLLVPDNWHSKRLPRTNEPMYECTQYHGSENRTRVIHVVLCNRQHLRERHPKNHEYDVAQGKDVDRYAVDTHFERAVRGRWAPNLAQQHEENGEKIRYVESEGLERDECVEGCCAGDVDERETCYYCADEEEGVDRQFEGGVYLGWLLVIAMREL